MDAFFDIVENFFKIMANIYETFKNILSYKLDLSIIGLGEVSLLVLFGGTLLFGFLVYKFVRWMI